MFDSDSTVLLLLLVWAQAFLGIVLFAPKFYPNWTLRKFYIIINIYTLVYLIYDSTVFE